MKCVNLFELENGAIKSRFWKNVENLYVRALPEVERLDFSVIKNGQIKNSIVFVFLDDNEYFLGFSFCVKFGNILYIIYLAINEESRNKSYGSKALEMISDSLKSETLFLCVEKPKNSGDIKSRRINFYKRNNFLLSDLITSYCDDDYFIMYKGRYNEKLIKKAIVSVFPGCNKFRTRELKYYLVDKDNLAVAVTVQNTIFPNEKSDQDFIDSIEDTFPNYFSFLHYYLAYDSDKLIGICGIYGYKDYAKDAWLGWFGVLEEERRKGYGTKILQYVYDMAKELGFETFRLYTDEIDNSDAVKLYEKFGMTKEYYKNIEDKHYEIGKTLIYSKSLSGKKLKRWNNKNIFLGFHDKRNGII